ncbi:ABC transporter permease [Aquimarina algicola]|uniref:FtsX-like permease family protein n=1 Tax=Aquimarina algicola TaxID=2589995 RepID=A0A504JHX9_9FLAO|nr:ABC transporter permease [Aquimarina algicola]TPN88015.1 FtsX-like permease family protein [Aquimarina algicola]
MFKNYLKIAWRNIAKDKFFAFIKIAGFALGIAACILISLYIKDELSYDKHYENKDRIFRVYSSLHVDGKLEQWSDYPAPFATALMSDFPEIEKAGRYLNSELFGTGSKELRVEGQTQNVFESGFIYADQELLEIFEIPFSKGKKEEALTSPGTIVISEEKANTYFPNGDAIGQTLILGNDTKKPYKITGVMKKTNQKSHFDFDFLMTTKGRDFYPGEDTNWRAQNYYTYIKLNEQADPKEVEIKLQDIIKKYFIPDAKNRGDQSMIPYLKEIKFHLQPVPNIHLYSNDIQDRMQHGDIRFVWLFAAIAGFILFLACINFINLSTAKSANRAKEVGLRKTIGAFKTSLIYQFLIESTVFSLISFGLGILLATVLLPTFNTIASKDLSIPWTDWWFIPTLLTSSLIIGVISGLYPAFYLSAFRPSSVLKGQLSIGSKSKKLRSGLVIFQFTTSIVLIISTLIIYQQMDFILTKKLGYNKEQVIIIKGTASLENQTEAFKESLENISDIQSVSISDYLPVHGSKRNMNSFWRKGKFRQERAVGGQIWRVDKGYVETLGLTIKEGRNFSERMATDSAEAAIINEKMAKELGFAKPVGEYLTNGELKKIIAVVEDFHFDDLKKDIQPLVLTMGNSPGMITARLQTNDFEKSVGKIQSIWDMFIPNQSFRYTFLDQDFAKMHAEVNRTGKIFNSFAVFAIFVACLGLFALSAFMVEQRKKEISIRLVLGAPFKSIYKLLTLDFMRLIVIAVLIAIPIGWFMMNRWLEDFAYRTQISWEVFLLSGFIAFVVALFTISYQSIKAAIIKPLNSLKTE